MRMNPREETITAFDLVNTKSAEDLARIFWDYGEERLAKRIAAAIVRERSKRPVATSGRLAEIVCSCYGRQKGPRRIHPATRVFQALRIATNDELSHLFLFLENVADCLLPGKRVCMISFNSLEDRMVKRRFFALERGCTCPPGALACVCGKKSQGRALPRRAVRPGPEEVAKNPMARSARLRVFQKS
jgi:16S rRNA (cytosine1402-N4)-methyltransferase